MTRISVIVPFYNTGGYIRECIESLRNQDFTDFEVVCVDDGSTDDTPAIAARAAKGDGRFVFVRRENGGLSAARNTGLAHASGDYVLFLDSDDKYVPGALKRLDDVARATGADLVDFMSETFYESDSARALHEEDNSARDAIEGVMAGPDLFCKYVEKGQFVVSACYHLIRRSVLDGNGLRFGEGLVHEDELFSPVLYAYVERATFLHECLYFRRIHPGSIMTSGYGVRNVHSMFRITQLLHAWLLENAPGLDTAFIDAFSSNHAVLCDAVFRRFNELPDELASSYLDSLDVQDRVAFDLTCRYAPEPADIRFHEIENSRSYQAARRIARLIGR